MLPERIEEWTGRTVVCFGAHTDDDLHAAGTFARLAAAGNAVHLVMYTDDDKGSLDRSMTSARLTQIRRREQESAARALGILPENLHWLGHGDGELEYVDRRELCREAAALLRHLRPDAVFSFDPGTHWEQWHKSDHRSAAQNTMDAIRAARWHLYFPELLEAGKILVYSIDGPAKIEAFCAHVSQFGRRLYKYEPELHPEDRAAFDTAIRDYTASVGAPHGLAFAEAFRRLTDP